MAFFETSTSSPTRARDDLQGYYSAYNPANRGYVADMVLPRLAVGEEAGTYSVIPREVWLQHVVTKTAAKAPASTSDFTSTSDTFQLVEYAHKSLATQRQARQYRSFYDLEQVETERIAGIIALDREVDTATAVFNTTTFATSGVNTGAATAKWDAAASVPITDVATGKYALIQNYGTEPNALIMTYYTYSKLMISTQFRAAFTGFYPGGLIPALAPLAAVAAIFGVEKVIVPRGIRNTAAAGLTPSFSSIWNEDLAMLCRIEDGMDHSAPQLGRTLELDGKGPEIRSWESNDPAGTWIRAGHIMQAKTMTTPVGYLVTDVKT